VINAGLKVQSEVGKNMTMVQVNIRHWHLLADVIQDLGNYHLQLKMTEAGQSLDILGNAIKCSLPYGPCTTPWLMEQAASIIDDLGLPRSKPPTIPELIDAVEHILGLWNQGAAASS